jgi:outer membrane protein
MMVEKWFHPDKSMGSTLHIHMYHVAGLIIKGDSMKHAVFSVLFGAFLLGWSWVVNAAELTVRLEEPPLAGVVAFVLFDSANAFGDLRNPALVVKHPLDGRDLYHIENIPSGEYALLVYYDENNNGKIDKNFIGIPREPLGFSNRYEPKGPPSYSRAAFVLGEGESRHFDVALYRPLGKLGRLGVGLGVITRSSPYRDYNGGVSQVIPAITYTGSRLQIYGPNVKFGLVGSGKLRLAATGNYRIGVYEEDESDFLQGMGDRKDTFMAGVALQAELPGGVDLSGLYEHDVLDEIGGGAARLGLSKSFQAGVFRFSPRIGLNWLSSGLSNHDFGVPPESATPERPAYDPGDTVSVEGGLGMFVEITKAWLLIASASVEFLDDRVTDSPIVAQDYVIKGFGAINYVF